MPGRDAEATKIEDASRSSSDLSISRAALDSPLTQIIGVAILEFGVLLHRSVTSRSLEGFVLIIYMNIVFSLDLPLRLIRTSKFCSWS